MNNLTKKVAALFVITLGSAGLTGCQALTDTITDLRGGKSASASSVEAETPAGETKSRDRRDPVKRVMDVNTASFQDLMMAPGMTKETANLVIDARPFIDMLELDDDFDSMDLSEAERNTLYKSVFLRVHANDGAAEDMYFIPGLSRKNAHRIKTARPFSDMEDFEQKLSKFTGEDETARLLQYFTFQSTAG